MLALFIQVLHCDSKNRDHPDINQSQGRTKTIDSNFFKSSQSNVWYRKMKSQRLLTGDEYATTASVNFLSSNCLSCICSSKCFACSETQPLDVEIHSITQMSLVLTENGNHNVEETENQSPLSSKMSIIRFIIIIIIIIIEISHT